MTAIVTRDMADRYNALPGIRFICGYSMHIDGYEVGAMWRKVPLAEVREGCMIYRRGFTIRFSPNHIRYAWNEIRRSLWVSTF